jgi:hypothetical protein
VLSCWCRRERGALSWRGARRGVAAWRREGVAAWFGRRRKKGEEKEGEKKTEKREKNTKKRKRKIEKRKIRVRTMCGSRTGGWSLPCVMSD